MPDQYFLYLEKEKAFHPLKDGMFCGRDGCDLNFPADPEISPIQCQFRFKGDEVFVVDVSGKDGTRVNGETLAWGLARKLKLDDVLEVGQRRLTLSNRRVYEPGLLQDRTVSIGSEPRIPVPPPLPIGAPIQRSPSPSLSMLGGLQDSEETERAIPREALPPEFLPSEASLGQRSCAFESRVTTSLKDWLDAAPAEESLMVPMIRPGGGSRAESLMIRPGGGSRAESLMIRPGGGSRAESLMIRPGGGSRAESLMIRPARLRPRLDGNEGRQGGNLPETVVLTRNAVVPFEAQLGIRVVSVVTGSDPDPWWMEIRRQALGFLPAFLVAVFIYGTCVASVGIFLHFHQ